MSENNSDEVRRETDMTFGEMMEYRSKNYFLVYIDILGYRDFKEINGDKELFASLEMARMTARAIFSPLLKMKDGTDVHFKIGMKMYTDSILLFVEIKDDGFDFLRFPLTIALLAQFQINVLKNCNLLIRGAITHGKCYLDEFIFGDPYLEAYNLESKKAIWSRILISENTMKNHIDDLTKEKFIREDENGLFFIDYLCYMTEFLSKNDGDPSRFLKEHYDMIVRTAKNTFHKDMIFKVHPLKNMIDLRKKSRNYHELSLYHNSVCDKYGCDDVKLPIVSAPNTFLEDYDDYNAVWNVTTHENTENLKNVFEKMLKSFEDTSKAVEHDLRLLKKIEDGEISKL